MNSIFKMRLAVIPGLVLLGMFAVGSASGQPCVYDHTAYSCLSNGWVTLIAPTTSPCVSLGDSVTISADKTIVDDGNETIVYYRNTTSDQTPDEMPGCPADVSYANDAPTYTVTWAATMGNTQIANGTGLTATFTPPNPGSGTVSFTCNYANQSPCSGTGTSGATGSFTVLKPDEPYDPGNTVTMNAYFLVENVGYRLYSHALYEQYEKEFFCDNPTEKWYLASSLANLTVNDDPISWGEEHEYSFQSGYTAMGDCGSSGIGAPGTLALCLNSGIFVLPQSGLQGTAQTTSLAWEGEGGNTPATIISGGTVSVPIQ